MTAATKRYSEEYLMSVRHLGPAMLGADMEEGKEIHRQAQALTEKTAGGRLGPALLSTEPVGHNKPAPKPETAAAPAAGASAPASKGKGK